MMKKILCVGGGTLGPVTPLLSAALAVRRMRSHTDVIWVGTPDGPERSLVEDEGMRFISLPVLKLPRRLDPGILLFPFRWAKIRALAMKLLEAERPHVVVSVGGFTAVPIARAAASLGIACVTHQLDVIPGLANRAMARSCASVTTSFAYDQRPFGAHVMDERIPTPVRFSRDLLPARHEAATRMGLSPHKPIVFVFGGGTGALAINRAVERLLPMWLSRFQVIHVTGKGRDAATSGPQVSQEREGYRKKEFMNAQEMMVAYAAADLVVCRAGIGALSEIAALQKAAVLIPIPRSHQEANAAALVDLHAVLLVHQDRKDHIFYKNLSATLFGAIADQHLIDVLGRTVTDVFPTDDGTAFAERIIRIAEAAHR